MSVGQNCVGASNTPNIVPINAFAKDRVGPHSRSRACQSKTELAAIWPPTSDVAREAGHKPQSLSAATTTSQQPTGRSPSCVAGNLVPAISGGPPALAPQRWPGRSQRSRHLITSNASVVPADDALFADMPGQYWRIR